ncbi:hypothetical protein DDY07_09840 [Methylomonas sp. ZR1]|nr:hypothetical protein [Methylomonas sp. ZR1]
MANSSSAANEPPLDLVILSDATLRNPMDCRLGRQRSCYWSDRDCVLQSTVIGRFVFTDFEKKRYVKIA